MEISRVVCERGMTDCLCEWPQLMHFRFRQNRFELVSLRCQINEFFREGVNVQKKACLWVAWLAKCEPTECIPTIFIEMSRTVAEVIRTEFSIAIESGLRILSALFSTVSSVWIFMSHAAASQCLASNKIQFKLQMCRIYASAIKWCVTRKLPYGCIMSNVLCIRSVISMSIAALFDCRQIENYYFYFAISHATKTMPNHYCRQPHKQQTHSFSFACKFKTISNS